jgi:hypothetical protein
LEKIKGQAGGTYFFKVFALLEEDFIVLNTGHKYCQE